MKNNKFNEGPTIEWHYAPLAGVLGKKIDDEWEQLDGGLEKYHENMNEFLRSRDTGDLILKEEINYGHPHFHGHRGLVQVYIYIKRVNLHENQI